MVGVLPKEADRFYNTPEWKRLRDYVLKRDNGECQLRLPGCAVKQPKMYVDHIVEIKDGGAKLDPANLMATCPPCHGKKTESEKQKRFKR